MKQLFSLAMSALSCVALVSSSFAQTTWYIDASAPFPGSGTPSAPYTGIQYAIWQPNVVSGDTLLVAPGTYVENVDYSGKDLVVRSSGGAAVTIIDGGQSDTCVRIQNGEGPTTVLDGFTVRNGLGGDGGGILCFNSSPRIANCVIVDNSATSSGGGVWGGFCHLTLERCVIAHNDAFDGGGLRVDYGSSSAIEHCTITDNSGVSAAGMALRYGTNGTVKNTIVWGNLGPSYDVFQASPTISYCDIAGGYAGTGNFDADPQFVSAATGNWKLAYGSPCIDAGDPAGALDPDGSRADVGAIAFQCGGIASYCTSGTTTNNCNAVIVGVGTPSATASSGFVLAVSGLEGQRQGIVFYGVSGRAALPWAAGSTSFLCVKQPTQRMNVQNSGGTINVCNGAFSVDWNAYASSHPTALGQPFAIGQVVQAQAWFRDPPSPKTTNLSNAFEFGVCP